MSFARDVSTTAADLAWLVAGRPTSIGFPEWGTLVTEGWQRAQNYANRASFAASSFLAALTDQGNPISVPPISGALAQLVADLSELTETPPIFEPPIVVSDTAPYTDTELEALYDQLEGWIAGDFTGLPLVIEEAIWRRAIEQDVRDVQTATRDLLQQAATSGFPRPPGSAIVQMQKLAREASQKAATTSRDIAAKQADLMQSNRHFAMDMAWKIHAALMAYLRDQMQRALDAAKATVALDIQANASDVQAVQAIAAYHSRRVEAEVSIERARVDVAVANANLMIEGVKAPALAELQRAMIAAEKLVAAARVSAALAASALTAVSMSASTNESAATQGSFSYTKSDSVSASISGSSNIQENYTP